MERGSSKHGPRLDDEIKHETEGMIRSNRPTRVEEFRETEPVLPDDDEPGAGAGPG